MKIGIDVSQIVFKTGVSFYTSNLVKALAKIDKRDNFIIFGSSLRLKKDLEKKLKKLNLGKNFKEKLLSFPPSFFEILWNKFHLGKVEDFIGEVDIFHASDWIQPPARKAKIITTIHDLSFLKYPEYFPARILRNQKLRLRWIKKEAKAIIAVSQATKKDIIKFLNIEPARIYVIYEAIPEEHQFKITKEEVEKIKKKYNLKDYLLVVGTREPRKNLKRIIEAYNILVADFPKLSLVVVGKKGWGVKSSKLKTQNSKIKFLEQIPDEELAALYSGAKCFVYPSLYEGFGLPVLESMFYGCPVVTSNLSSLPEIAGEAALLVNPKRTQEISQAIKKIIEDRTIYNKLRIKGWQQIKKFSWGKTAKETLEVYQDVNRY